MDTILIVASATVFYKIGNSDYKGRGDILMTASLLISGLSLPFGFLVNAAGQGLLLIGLFVYNMYNPRAPLS